MSESEELEDEVYDDDLLEADEKFVKALQLFFVKNYQNLYEDIRKNIDEGDISAAYRLTHSLKGNAGQIGRPDLQKAAIDVERLLKDGKNNVTEDLFKTLDTELKIVLNELAPLLNEA